MIKILIDEDIPRSTLKVLNGVGYEVLDVQDYGLRGKSDGEIFKFAQQTGAVILTGDVGFRNLFRFLIGKHYGIFIVHFPNEISASELNQQIMKALEVLIETDFIGNLIILEPGKIRVRRR